MISILIWLSVIAIVIQLIVWIVKLALSNPDDKYGDYHSSKQIKEELIKACVPLWPIIDAIYLKYKAFEDFEKNNRK